ncbi:MAG TPA: DNA topoisomerase IB [Chitinophagaceae bacterium]|nr:DNA topoisomerase IB [Chitinophagaceae bacterium]
MQKLKSLSYRDHLKLHRDYRRAARVASLLYTTDTKPGITRIKKGKGYGYTFRGRSVTQKEILERIRKLAIPPSWTSVWICPKANGHIQATGIDMNGRKQYRYHPDWNKCRQDTKFHRLIEFGKALPKLRRQIRRDMNAAGLTESKVLATVINLAEKTYIRVGNNGYEKMYGSYGLTTMKDKHVTLKNGRISFTFTGKKGVAHEISIYDRKLARIIKQCRDIPGKELFQYYSDSGDRKCIDSGMVNNYIKTATGGEFTTKDFRTWAGSLHALQILRTLDPPQNDADLRKNIAIVMDHVSNKLGNTRNICKKYYVHPELIKLYEEDKLNSAWQPAPKTSGLDPDEQILMQVIKRPA